MKRFLIRFALFTSCCGAFLLMLLGGTCFYLNRKGTFALRKASHRILVGHSHAECGVNDSLIKDLTNCAKSGESYFYTYQKVKKLIEHNPQLQTVFIEFSNKQVSEVADNWISKTEFMTGKYLIWAPFLDFNQQIFLWKKNPTGMLNVSAKEIFSNLTLIAKRDLDYTRQFGGYLAVNRTMPESESRVAEVYKKDILATENLLYLERIVQLCKDAKKQVYLIRCPVFKRAYQLPNEKGFQTIRNDRFSEVPFLDFNTFPLLYSDMADRWHLNYTGARKFSSFLERLFSEKLLEQENKQAFIDSKIKELQSAN